MRSENGEGFVLERDVAEKFVTGIAGVLFEIPGLWKSNSLRNEFESEPIGMLSDERFVLIAFNSAKAMIEMSDDRSIEDLLPRSEFMQREHQAHRIRSARHRDDDGLAIERQSKLSPFGDQAAYKLIHGIPGWRRGLSRALF